MISVGALCLRSGDFRLENISFEIPSGACGVLMGKTGSGKTSILEALCGLRPVESGSIRLDGREVSGLSPAERGIGYVPQDRALFRTMTVGDHLAFGPRVRRWEPAKIAERVGELAGLLGIEDLLERKPVGLSGGEAQRVALGRALAARPEVLLLDEPLSALDDETWEEMLGLLGDVRKRTGVTTLHVTHRREEARRLADRIYVLKEGVLREVAPADLQEAMG